MSRYPEANDQDSTKTSKVLPQLQNQFELVRQLLHRRKITTGKNRDVWGKYTGSTGFYILFLFSLSYLQIMVMERPYLHLSSLFLY